MDSDPTKGLSLTADTPGILRWICANEKREAHWLDLAYGAMADRTIEQAAKHLARLLNASLCHSRPERVDWVWVARSLIEMQLARAEKGAREQ